MGRQQPHALLLPLPLQGPINCFLKLAELLCLSSATTSDVIDVTFICAAFINRRLPDLHGRFLTRFPNFRLSLVSDGISGHHPRPTAMMPSMVRAVEAEVVRRLKDSGDYAAVTCLIADGVFTGAGETAMGLGIPVVYFSTLSPSCIWAHSCLVLSLVEAREVPFQAGVDLDEPMTKIPGMETFLRRRDLPGVCRAHDMNDPYIQLILRECKELPNAQGHILNTYDGLEEPLLAHLGSLFPNLYTVGPLHLHLKARLQQLETEPKAPSCNSLWKEDRSCLAWLDSQPSGSVIYVSIGSIGVMTTGQLMEFWSGLVNSGVRFLWVRRPGSVVGLEGDDYSQLEVPTKLLEGTKERGFFVSWAPQEEVLAHRAIGGFLTHSGWNSTLESIAEGVPMISWPSGIDQTVISRFVGEVWKIGIDMKDKCDRVVIENMVRDLMERRRDEFCEKANLMFSLAKQAVSKGGSSWLALDRLIEDIKFMRLQVQHDTS